MIMPSDFSSIFNHTLFPIWILVQPASWIIDSLHLGKLLPVTEDKHSSSLTLIKVQELPTSIEFSAEIWNLHPPYLATRFAHLQSIVCHLLVAFPLKVIWKLKKHFTCLCDVDPGNWFRTKHCQRVWQCYS